MTNNTIEELDLSIKGLTKLPDLTKYTNLKKLNCSENKLTHLDNLPINLTELNCSYNKLTHLDNLPINLTTLYCFDNSLTYDFNPTLENIRKYNKKKLI